jgi:heme exporter protein A
VVALRPLDLRVETGELLALLGPNGAGKSTLLRLLAGLARPSAGTLRVGASAAGSDRRERRRAVGLVGHESLLYPALTARENLILAGRLFGVPGPAERAAALLAADDLELVADRRAGELSRGLAQRVAIARALVHDPPILLLDEPFSGLDPRAAAAFAGRLEGLRDARRTIVLATHDLDRAAGLADRALLLVRGFSALLTGEVTRDRAALERRYLAGLGTPPRASEGHSAGAAS